MPRTGCCGFAGRHARTGGPKAGRRGAHVKPNTFYTPDFAVMRADGALEVHEVKGFWTDDARVKIKVAADQYPMRFIAVKVLPKKQGGGWVVEEF